MENPASCVNLAKYTHIQKCMDTPVFYHFMHALLLFLRSEILRNALTRQQKQRLKNSLNLQRRRAKSLIHLNDNWPSTVRLGSRTTAAKCQISVKPTPDTHPCLSLDCVAG